MLGSQQRLALTLVLIDLGKLRLQVFQLALKRATVAGQEMQEALELGSGIARRLVQIQNFADLIESKP